MANWDDIILQLANGQQALHNTLQQYITMQAAGGAAHSKKVVPAPELYGRSPQKFHEWWSKTKVWVATTHATASDREKAVAVFSCLEGPHAGRYAQVCLDECMVTNTWPHGQISKWRSRISSSQETTRSGQGPNSTRPPPEDR